MLLCLTLFYLPLWIVLQACLFTNQQTKREMQRERKRGKIRPNSQSATCTHNCQICISINSLSVCVCSNNNNNDNKKLSRYLSFSQWHLFSCSLPAFYIFCHTLWLACKRKGMIGSTVGVEGSKEKGAGSSMPTIDYFYNANDARWSITIFILNLLNVIISPNSFSAICNSCCNCK